MDVRTLIDRLKEMDQDAQVMHLWDGVLRTSIDHVYMAQSGICATADSEECVIYNDEDRPEGAPMATDAPYWNLSDE